MKLVVTQDNRFLQLESFKQDELDQVYLSLRKRIKNHYFHPLVKKKLWDGYIDFIDKQLRIPLGLWNIIQGVCEEYSYDFEIDGLERVVNLSFDEEQFRSWVKTFFDGHEIQPRKYQIDAAISIIKWKRSISEIATSAGKTLIIFMVFAYLKHIGELRRMLIVVPNTNLIIQTTEDFEEYSQEKSRLNYTIQTVHGGESKGKKNVDLVIGTYHSLRNMDREFFAGINIVCVDEAHHTQTKSIKTVLSMCNDADFRFGLSGTMGTGGDNADSYTIQSFLGPMVNKISPAFLTRNKFATPINVKMVYLNYLDLELREKLKLLHARKSEMDGTKLYGFERKLIVENEKRFDYVCQFISQTSKNALVLFSNVKDAYGRRIYDRLRDITSDREVYYVDGGTSTEDRDYFKKCMEEGSNKILVASFGTFSTGISINNIHTVVFCESYRSEKIIKQSIGRGMRLCMGKDTVTIVDFVDDFSCKGFKNYSIRHAEARRELYDKERFRYKSFSVQL